MYRVSIIGAGNVATQFAIAFQRAGHSVICVCNRDLEKAEQLCRVIGRYKGKAICTSDCNAIPECDIVFICVADSAIGTIAANISNPSDSTVYVHTSGATPIDVFKSNPAIKRYGVFYPLMTLSKNKNLDIRMVPFLLEATGKPEAEILANLVKSLRAEYNICTSQKRLQMHTAAVFTTNFVNYMLTLAYEIAHPDFTFLLPSAIEAVRKAFLHTPKTAQTGPALRKDMQTLQRHMQLLEEGGYTEHLEIYKKLSECIMERYSDKILENKQNNN